MSSFPPTQIVSTQNSGTILVSSGSPTTIGYTSGTWITSNGYTYTPKIEKSKYIVLGKEIEVDGSKDFNVGLCISLINILGIEYYLELKKQDITFPNEIGDFLEEQIVTYYRNKSIDEIIN